jgi:phytoene synthase
MSNIPPSPFLTELKSKDYERYILCLFAPTAKRDDLAALFLLNAELASIRDQVTEPLLGQMRLQWWRDGLRALGTTAQPPHAILNRLATLARQGHDVTPLQNLLDAREQDLLERPFTDTAAYENYVTATTRPLGVIAADLLEQKPAAATYAAALANYAQTGLLRAIPFWLRRHQLPLPPDLLAAHGIDGKAWLAERPQPNLSKLVGAMVAQSVERIATVQQVSAAMQHSERRIGATFLLHNELAGFYAAQLRRSNCDVLNPRLATPHPLRLPFLFWRSVRTY